jgi:hypothetical protein
MLQQACATRARAERVRQLAYGLAADAAVRDLLAYAEELDRHAVALDDRACALAATIATTEVFSAEISSLIAEAQARLATARARRRSDRDRGCGVWLVGRADC